MKINEIHMPHIDFSRGFRKIKRFRVKIMISAIFKNIPSGPHVVVKHRKLLAKIENCPRNLLKLLGSGRSFAWRKPTEKSGVLDVSDPV